MRTTSLAIIIQKSKSHSSSALCTPVVHQIRVRKLHGHLKTKLLVTCMTLLTLSSVGVTKYTPAALTCGSRTLNRSSTTAYAGGHHQEMPGIQFAN